LNNPEGSNKHYNSLQLFCRKNYLEYKNNKDKFINLSEKLINKLKIITLIELVEENKNIDFDRLYTQLDITNHFELDSIIFEAISQGLITGKVDQKNKILKVGIFK
jgi:COP9 signalosome complex subunit 7